MTAKTTTQAHNNEAEKLGFKAIADQQIARTQAMFDEMMKLEEKRAELLTQTVDESAKLMKASIEYARRLSTEWTEMAMSNAKSASEIFGGSKN